MQTHKPQIRITKDPRSCNCCLTQNYRGRFDTEKTRYADTIYEIVVDHMVSAVCPDCLRSLGSKIAVLLNGDSPTPAGTDAICVHVRDLNGKREALEFRTASEVLNWAESCMSENDEILLITQGNICLYSALQAYPTMPLTRDDITGFFA